MDSIYNFIDQMSQSAKPSLRSVLSQQSHENPSSEHVVGNVLVHCDQGVSRSATAVVAYLMRKHHATLSDALTMVQKKRKVKPNPNFMDQLQVWEQVEYQIWEDAEKKVPKLPYATYLEKRAEVLKSLGLTGNEPIAPVNLRDDA
jgi:dual specificity phosphatase 12